MNVARTRNVNGNLDAIAHERARLQAELAKLDAAEKAAMEVARDAGRETLISALGKVKIAAMSKADARSIAQAIGAMETAELVRKLVA